MECNLGTEAKSRDADIIRNAGLWASRPRLQILAYLRDRRDHPTADQIYAALLPNCSSLSKMTVYNTLRAFTGHGLCRDVRIESDIVRYDPNVEDHGHFKCSDCGRVFDFSVPETAFRTEDLDGFEIVQKDVFFRGLCPDCVGHECSSTRTN